MIASFFQYLLESSFCLLAFSLLYQLCFARLTHFSWMRFCLLTSILLSVLLPLLDGSFQSLLSAFSTEPVQLSTFKLTPSTWLAYDYGAIRTQSGPSENSPAWLMPLFIFFYASGVGFYIWRFAQNLFKIRKLIKLNPKVKDPGHWLVFVTEKIPAFTFLNYIFLGVESDQLHQNELQKIKQHEMVHVRQKHTLDLLLVELTAIIFWFNPLLKYLKHRLQEVHEYLADEAIVHTTEQQKAYAHLLIRLASPVRTIPLSTSFTNKQIHNRITMLMKTRTLAQKKFYFLLLLPLITSLMFLLSCIDENPEDLKSVSKETLAEQSDADTPLENGKKIASIRWEGNSLYSDEKLSEVLGLKPGDIYNKELLNSRLNFNPELDDVSSLYMDNGYLFLNINVNENQVGPGVADLVFDIYEGEQFKTENIIIKGIQSVSKEEILSQLSIKTGDWFDRAGLIASQKAIAEMGYFDPEKVGVNPIPHPEKGTVDIEFVLIEIKTKN